MEPSAEKPLTTQATAPPSGFHPTDGGFSALRQAVERVKQAVANIDVPHVVTPAFFTHTFDEDPNYAEVTIRLSRNDYDDKPTVERFWIAARDTHWPFRLSIGVCENERELEDPDPQYWGQPNIA